MIGLKSQKVVSHYKKEQQAAFLTRLLIIVVIICTIWAQNNYIVTRKYVFETQDLQKSLVGYRVLHISDICNTNNNIAAKARKAKPDVIVLSGGYQDKHGKYNRTVKIVNKLCKIAPVYYIYNKKDSTQCLEGTEAVNITDTSVKLKQDIKDVESFIKKNYGSSIIKKAKKNDNDALQYMQYISDELQETESSAVTLCGIDNETFDNPQDLVKKSYDITGENKKDMIILVNGNISNVNTLAESNADMILMGGTFGMKNDETPCTKGTYSYLGVELFLSGGCGTLNKTRIFNLPEIQLITLSDGTIKQRNPLERLLNRLIGDVGTIFDNDGGFHEYTKKY